MLINRFYEENEKRNISNSAAKLYFFLIYRANKIYWEGPLIFSIRSLSGQLSMNKNTVMRSTRELKERKLILYYPGEKNKQVVTTTFWFPKIEKENSEKIISVAEKGEKYAIKTKYSQYF
ncbi:MAG TPA: hypothetical protein PK723_02685 [Candidatus Pacearchaeota archaeon]|nr:hypothetical protein [Candidatus Pacearchaeota archaeon]